MLLRSGSDAPRIRAQSDRALAVALLMRGKPLGGVGWTVLAMLQFVIAQPLGGAADQQKTTMVTAAFDERRVIRF